MRTGDVYGPSSWIEVDQARIDAFAAATGDHPWIHVDADRAAQGPFRGTIGHGYLTLSLIPVMSYEVLPQQSTGMGINYGLNRVRFPSLYRRDHACAGHSKSLRSTSTTGARRWQCRSPSSAKGQRSLLASRRSSSVTTSDRQSEQLASIRFLPAHLVRGGNAAEKLHARSGMGKQATTRMVSRCSLPLNRSPRCCRSPSRGSTKPRATAASPTSSLDGAFASNTRHSTPGWSRCAPTHEATRGGQLCPACSHDRRDLRVIRCAPRPPLTPNPLSGREKPRFRGLS